MLRQKEEKLKSLRDGSRVTLGEVDVPEDEQLDEEVKTHKRDIKQTTSGSIWEYLL